MLFLLILTLSLVLQGAITSHSGDDDIEYCNRFLQNEENCTCPPDYFTCACAGRYDNCTGSNKCVPEEELCNGYSGCPLGSDERNCTDCHPGNLKCGCIFKHDKCSDDTVQCISEYNVLDSHSDCEGGKDEICRSNFVGEINGCGYRLFQCESEFLKNETLTFFSKTNSTSKCWPVDIINQLNVSDITTEWRCVVSDTVYTPDYCIESIFDFDSLITCENEKIRKPYVVCNFDRKCFADYNTKGSNIGFRCKPKASYACWSDVLYLPQSNLYDSDINCSDGSDLCFVEGSLKCFRCLDGSLLISTNQVCDGFIDCYDMSDECLCENQTVCNAVSAYRHELCPNGQIYCSTDLGCVEYDTYPIVYDDCVQNYSTYAYRHIQYQKSILCSGADFYGFKCDGAIDCPNMEDECNCENRPSICEVTGCWFQKPNSVYSISFCDGVPSQAYIYMPNLDINITAEDLDETRDNITEMLAFVEELTQKPNHENMPVCPYGFDEINCTNRHYCRQGRSVSIEQSRTCDGIVDCDDASDETFALCASRRFYCVNKMPLSVDLKLVENGIKDCTDGSDECPVNSNKSSIFSSQFEMIGNPFLRAFFWIMGFAAIFGNLLVLCYTSRKFATKQHKNKVQKSNDWFIINLSIADLLMGIYLIATGIKGVEFSGRYCYYDLEWRSSQFCNILGVFVLLSSQASVFIMAIMTTFRIMGVVCPIKLRNMKVAVIALPTTLAWVGAISISIMPMLNFQSGYFVSGLWYPNNFLKQRIVSKSSLITLASRITNKTFGNWIDVRRTISTAFEVYQIQGEIGYFGDTSVCMPRLFVHSGEDAWEYTTFVICVNISLFFYILVSYVFIYKKGTQMKSKSTDNSRNMQNRIARLVLTDFLCWVPICIMSFISLAGVDLNKIVYAVSAGVLLPINSALNPIIYSKFVETGIEKMWSICTQPCSKYRRAEDCR